MFQRLSTDTINWIIIIGVLLIILELSFFGGGLIFSALFSGLFIYVGWKNFLRLWGKVSFWIGIISLFFSILNMMAVRFVILAVLALFVLHYLRSKKEAEQIEPRIQVIDKQYTEPLIQIKPLFSHQFFRDQKTDETVYSWNDINIHGGFGDRIIDLSNTVLPEDTAIISIRHLIGNIEIYVPYEVEVSIQHSSMYGKVFILGNTHHKLVNKTFTYQTEDYPSQYPRVKIITSLLSGDIEVKRI